MWWGSGWRLAGAGVADVGAVVGGVGPGLGLVWGVDVGVWYRTSNPSGSHPKERWLSARYWFKAPTASQPSWVTGCVLLNPWAVSCRQRWENRTTPKFPSELGLLFRLTQVLPPHHVSRLRRALADDWLVTHPMVHLTIVEVLAGVQKHTDRCRFTTLRLLRRVAAENAKRRHPKWSCLASTRISSLYPLYVEAHLPTLAHFVPAPAHFLPAPARFMTFSA